MMSLAASAAMWGPGASIMNNATGGDVRSAALPSISESVMLSTLMGSHKYGFQSGGLVGYSTFFTGYDPARGHGMGRAMSIGRLVNKGVELGARGLMQAGVAGAERFAHMSQTGLAGALTAVNTKNIQPQTREIYESMVKSHLKPRHVQNPSPKTPMDAAVARYQRRQAQLGRRSNINSVGGGGGTTTKALRASERTALYRQAQKAALNQATAGPGRSKLFRFLSGWLGGAGFTETGKLNTVTKTFGNYVHTTGAAGSGGAVMTGYAGQWIGRAAKFSAWSTVAVMATDFLVDQVGQGFESATRATLRMQERTGTLRTMSPAYFNQAAVTERQRAVMELNSNILNPRTQIQGNEAAFFHR